MSSNEAIEPSTRKRRKISDQDEVLNRDWNEELDELSKHSAELESL